MNEMHPMVVLSDTFGPPKTNRLLNMPLSATLSSLVACLVILFGAASSRAESPLSSPRVSFGRHMPDGKDAAFYRSWAQPDRGAPRVFGAGQWTLETDRRSNLSYPRLVALTNGASVSRANSALEAMHGRILNSAYQVESAATRKRFGELDTLLGEFAVAFSMVKVTFLSTRTLSLVVTGEESHGGNGGSVLIRGAVVDISDGKIFTISACREEQERPLFTFGPLLTICDDRKLEAFRALWREQGRIVQSEAYVMPRTESWKNNLQEGCRAKVTTYIDEASLFSLYLTPGGLAVHNAFSSGGWANWCFTDRDSPFFPVVIPWHKLAPLMNPGPLRDELLALSPSPR
jgi:hypothetical protein